MPQFNRSVNNRRPDTRWLAKYPSLPKIVPNQAVSAILESMKSGRLAFQNKQRDLRRTIDPYRKPGHAHAAVCVLKHLTDFVKPTAIFSPKIWQDGSSQEGKHDLPAMSMTGKLQIKSPGCCAGIGKVRLVRQQDCCAVIAQLSGYLIQARS